MRKMTFDEFLAEKWRRADKDHSDLILAKLQKEKELEDLKEQIMMLEGFLTLVSSVKNEFEEYLKK